MARTRLALGLLVLPCLAFGARQLFLLVVRAPASGYVDRVTKAERRYDPVRGELPARGTVGYVLNVRSAVMLDWYQEYGLIWAQYTLAPLQVEFPKLKFRAENDAGGRYGPLWNIVLAIWDAPSRYDVLIEETDAGVRIIGRTAP